MHVCGSNRRIVRNGKGALTVDLDGGALIDFRLHEMTVNPLGFRFTRDQMPENNKRGASYKGHFACIGRWGSPSAGEIAQGVPDHGEVANLLWNAHSLQDDRKLTMQVRSALEGLDVMRTIEIDAENAVVAIEEKVRNINPLGRLLNVVQHPTLSAPFLDNNTIIDCNAAQGFDQECHESPEAHTLSWPDGAGTTMCMGDHAEAGDSIHSYIVDPASKLGWITAFSPHYSCVLGYTWSRKDYPWIHMWRQWDHHQIKYRGIEFGTAGLHQPYHKLLNHQLHIFNERTCGYIDAGEVITKRYLCFICKVDKGYTGTSHVEWKNSELKLTSYKNSQELILQTGLDNFL